MMHRVCAYCKKSLGWQMGPDGMTTHGVCDDCLTIELAKIKKEEGNGRNNASQG